jgi:hypothetical protein
MFQSYDHHQVENILIAKITQLFYYFIIIYLISNQIWQLFYKLMC